MSLIRCDFLTKSRLDIEEFVAKHPEDADMHSAYLCFYHTFGDQSIADAVDVLIEQSPYTEHMLAAFALIEKDVDALAARNSANASIIGSFMHDTFMGKYNRKLGDLVLDELDQLNKIHFLCGNEDLILTPEQMIDLSEQERIGYDLASIFRRPIELELGLNCRWFFARSNRSMLDLLEAGAAERKQMLDYWENTLHKRPSQGQLNDKSLTVIKRNIENTYRDLAKSYLNVIFDKIDSGIDLVHQSIDANVANSKDSVMDWSVTLTTPLGAFESSACDLDTLFDRVQHQVECLRAELKLPIIFDLSSIKDQIFAYGIRHNNNSALLWKNPRAHEVRLQRLAEMGVRSDVLSRQSIRNCYTIVAAQSSICLQDMLSPAVRNLAYDVKDGWISIKNDHNGTGRTKIGEKCKVTHVYVEGGLITKGPPNLKGTRLDSTKEPKDGDADADTKSSASTEVRPYSFGKVGSSQKLAQARANQGTTVASGQQSKRPQPTKGVKASTTKAAAVTSAKNTAVAPKGQVIKHEPWLSVSKASNYDEFPSVPPQESPTEKKLLEQGMRQCFAAEGKADPLYFNRSERSFEYLESIAPRTDFSSLEAFSAQQSRSLALAVKDFGERFPLGLYYLPVVVNCKGQCDLYYSQEILDECRVVSKAVVADSNYANDDLGSVLVLSYEQFDIEAKKLRALLLSAISDEVEGLIDDDPDVLISDFINNLWASEQVKTAIKQYLEKRMVSPTQLCAKRLTQRERARIKELLLDARFLEPYDDKDLNLTYISVEDMAQAIQLACGKIFQHLNEGSSLEELFADLGLSSVECDQFITKLQLFDLSLDSTVGQLPKQSWLMLFNVVLCYFLIAIKEQQEREHKEAFGLWCNDESSDGNHDGEDGCVDGYAADSQDDQEIDCSSYDDESDEDNDLFEYDDEDEDGDDDAAGLDDDDLDHVRAWAEDQNSQLRAKRRAAEKTAEQARFFVENVPNRTLAFYLNSIGFSEQEAIIINRYLGQRGVLLNRVISTEDLKVHLFNIFWALETQNEIAHKKQELGLPIADDKPKEKLSGKPTPDSDSDSASAFKTQTKTKAKTKAQSQKKINAAAYFDPQTLSVWLTDGFFAEDHSEQIKEIYEGQVRNGLSAPLKSGVDPTTAIIQHELFHHLDHLIDDQLKPYRQEIERLWREECAAWGNRNPTPVALKNPSEYFAERCMEYCFATKQARDKNPNIARVFEIAKRAYAEFVKAPPASPMKWKHQWC